MNEHADPRQLTTAASERTIRMLRPGARFGRYEIVCPLGAGGMGEVYRARDLQLGRELAIKVLTRDPKSGASDLERFEREARSASALTHPNIITIFEMGNVDDTYYIAMELVEGEPLRNILNRGAVPLQATMAIAVQIADGMAKAHEAGVIHRDLKPENVMLSRDQFVKILDFGIAKLFDTNSISANTSSAPNAFITRPGTVLGTIEYMSPEQAKGLPLDFRSDHFSFGSMLYEMVTGKRSFQRATKAETITAILRDQPESVAGLNPRAPAPLCWLIERCLAKSANDRFPSSRDLARDLASIRDRLSDAPPRFFAPQQRSLPTQPTALIGREREIASLKELLLREEVRLVTLTGPGGIGKTRLGLQVLEEVKHEFLGGVSFIPLAAVKEASLVPSIIGQALGLKESGQQINAASLKDFLRDLHEILLLFFDNFEHLLAAAPLVAEFLTVTPRLKILITSRARLQISGEREFVVPPLALPDLNYRVSASAIAENPAVALFVERAMTVKPTFVLNEENASAIATICTRLDGLPLAIELAAARIKLLSPSAMQARLESRLQLLTGGAKDLPLRQQTLRGTIDWSYGLLNEPAQALLRRASVFVGGCTLEGVEAVCNTAQDLEQDVLEGMSSLVDNSLVIQSEDKNGEPRFTLLDTIREYGLERLAASGEETATRRAHAAYCVVLAEEYSSSAASSTNTAWADLFELEHDNFRAALDWLTQTNNGGWGLRLGAAMFQFWDTREHLTEGRERLRNLLKMEAACVRSIMRARVLIAAGVLAGEQGDHAESHAVMEESLNIARELNDPRSIGIALNALAVNARDRGQLEEARSLFEESISLWRSLGDPVLVARSLSNLANIHKLSKQFAEARSLYEECRTSFRELGDRTGVARALNHEGDVAYEQGDNTGARALYEDSLKLFRELGDKWGVAGCLVDLGNLLRDQGDLSAAHSCYVESLLLFQELGQKRGIARLLDCMAHSCALRANPERALRLAGAAAALRRVLGVPLTATEKASLERMLQQMRQAVSSDLAAAAWMDGWTTPVDDLVQDARAGV
jgi:predicted ATPase/serine/threonine protein kinase